MSTEKLASASPPACEFDLGKFILQVDVLVESKVEAASPVVNKLMRLLKKTCCPPEEAFAVETALREALANAILHGNRQDPRKKVRVCCGCDSAGGLLIVVKDEGDGFDPAQIPSPLVGENVYSEHGRGVYLINLLMDKVQFAHGGKEVYMRKVRSAAQ